MKNKKIKFLVISLVTSIVISGSLWVNQVIGRSMSTQSTQAFSTGVLSYQGTLVDALGNPISGLLDIDFRLYNSPGSEFPLWQETRSGVNAVLVSNGLFNLMLGSLVPMAASVWEEPELYLGVKIGNDSEMSPREKLAFVPSAAMSEVAQLALSVPDGSIGEVHLSDDAISSKNVDLIHGEIYGSGEVLTLTATPQIIPSLSFTINTATPQVLQISVSLDAMFFPNCSTLLARVEVDDVPVGPIMTLASYSGVNVRSSISTTRQVNLSPGGHNVNFKAFCETSGTGTLGQILTGQSSVSYLLFSQ